MTTQCSSRSPSGRLCHRPDGHDGDHRSADERAWATEYQHMPTVNVEGAGLVASPEARATELPDPPPEAFEAQINSTLLAIAKLQAQLTDMQRACRAAFSPPKAASGQL